MIAIALVLFSFPAYAEEVYASWGCPTADGPISIAKAFRNLSNGGTDNDIGIAAQSHDCSVFPYRALIEPVRFVVETEDAVEIIYVWEVRFTGSETTFFSNFDKETDATFRFKMVLREAP